GSPVEGHDTAGQQQTAEAAAKHPDDQAQLATVRRGGQPGEGCFHRAGNPDWRSRVSHPADEGVGHGDQDRLTAIASGGRGRRLYADCHVENPPAELISASIISTRQNLSKTKMDCDVLPS